MQNVSVCDTVCGYTVTFEQPHNEQRVLCWFGTPLQHPQKGPCYTYMNLYYLVSVYLYNYKTQLPAWQCDTSVTQYLSHPTFYNLCYEIYNVIIDNTLWR